MPRIVLVVLALFLVWRILSAIGKRASSSKFGADSFSRFAPRQRRRRMDERRERTGQGPEELLLCESCGTYVPSGRSITDGGGSVFCSETCRTSAAGRGSDDV
jgi:hypothetical protein